MNRYHLLPLILIWALPLSSPASQAYLGGNLGYYRLQHEEFPDSSSEFDDERSSWKLTAGVQANPVLGFELGYVNFGSSRDRGVEIDADGIPLAVTASLPFSPNFALYGKLGQLFWERAARSSFGRSAQDGEDPFYGVGTRLGLAPNLDLRLEYERFDIDEADVDMASLGLNLKF